MAEAALRGLGSRRRSRRLFAAGMIPILTLGSDITASSRSSWPAITSASPTRVRSTCSSTMTWNSRWPV